MASRCLWQNIVNAAKQNEFPWIMYRGVLPWICMYDFICDLSLLARIYFSIMKYSLI